MQPISLAPDRFIGFLKTHIFEENDHILLEKSSSDDALLDHQYSPQQTVKTVKHLNMI